MSTNPTRPTRPQPPGPIWNPEAAANWSLPFSPAFGSYLHMLNWRTLGEPEKARAAFVWFLLSLGMLLASLLIVVAYPDSPVSGMGGRIASFVYLAVWYLTFARRQMEFVKKNYGDGYPRKKWGGALGVGVACLLAYFGAALLIGIAMGIAKGP